MKLLYCSLLTTFQTNSQMTSKPASFEGVGPSKPASRFCLANRFRTPG